MAYYNYYPAYVTIDELREKNQKKKKTYLKKHPHAHPVVLEGKLGKTWWGKSWNQNLERYADFDNRLPRGKKYIKAEAIFDFGIEEGHIFGDVSGSGRKIYHVDIQIDPLDQQDWKMIQKACGRRIDSLEQLIHGQFPKELKELFFQADHGLFPDPDEIHISCDCPDYAYMCKHEAAILYATSIVLDEDPQLFFKLRSIHIDDIIDQALGENVDLLIENAKKKTDRILEINDLDTLFHLE